MIHATVLRIEPRLFDDLTNLLISALTGHASDAIPIFYDSRLLAPKKLEGILSTPDAQEISVV